MRLVRFDDPAEGIALELHPLLTVISGLPVASRQRLITALAAIPRGEDPGVGGQLEVHGVLLDLDPASLELLELDADVDPVLRADDLPGRSAESDPEIPDPPDRSEEIAAARERARDAARRRSELEAARVQAETDLGELAAQRARVAARLDEARQGLDDYAAAGLKIAEDEFEALHRRIRDEALAAHEAERRRIEGELERLIAEVDELRRRMRGPTARDRSTVRAALEELLAALDPAMIGSAEAAELAAELTEVEAQLRAAAAEPTEGRGPLEELTARRDAAYDAMVAAEAALRSPEVDERVVSELESIHDEIFELDGRVSKLSASRVRRRIAELREREAGLLDQLGFDSWASYVMGVSTPAAEAERRERYEVARATYEFAEEELARAAGLAGSSTAPTRVALQARRDILLDRAAALLGRPVGLDEALEELRDLQVPVATGDVEGAARRLASALAAAGVAPEPQQGPDELVAAAQSWLGEAEADDGPSFEAVRVDLEAQIGRLAAELEALPTPESIVAATGDVELAEAQRRVEECRRRVERHRAALAVVGELRTADDELRAAEAEVERLLADTEITLGTLADEESAAIQQVAELERRAAAERDEVERRRWEAKRAVEGRGNDDAATLESVEWYVLARLAQQRAISFVGSAPLVIDDAFADWSSVELAGVLARLARMSDVIQIIYLTDDVEIAAWARGLGPDRAVVVDLTRSF